MVPAAYDAYLQGNYYASKRTGEAVTQAVADYRQAIQLDPTYAPSYAGLAGALALAADYKDVPSSQVLPEAEAAAVKALQLDDTLASAHAVDREYRVITALGADGSVPVPQTYALCTDESVIGTAFYLMQYVEGRIIWDRVVLVHEKV